VLPHGPLYDFLSFMCWYSFAANYDFLKPILFFVGRPNVEFKTWATKLGGRTIFLKSFDNLKELETRFENLFEEKHLLCMYNVFCVEEDYKFFDESLVSNDMIFRKSYLKTYSNYEIEDCKHNKFVPIVRFNFGDADLIAENIIHNNVSRKPFLAEKKALDESINEKKLDALYRRSREIYRFLMEGCHEQ
jgi:hypothetical protein